MGLLKWSGITKRRLEKPGHLDSETKLQPVALKLDLVDIPHDPLQTKNLQSLPEVPHSALHVESASFFDSVFTELGHLTKSLDDSASSMFISNDMYTVSASINDPLTKSIEASMRASSTVPCTNTMVPAHAVLNSDISDSEDKFSESSQDDDATLSGYPLTKSMPSTLAHRDKECCSLNNQDQSTVSKELKSKQISQGVSMIERMKDRHREQYRRMAMHQYHAAALGWQPSFNVMTTGHHSMMHSPMEHLVPDIKYQSVMNSNVGCGTVALPATESGYSYPVLNQNMSSMPCCSLPSGITGVDNGVGVAASNGMKANHRIQHNSIRRNHPVTPQHEFKTSPQGSIMSTSSRGEPTWDMSSMTQGSLPSVPMVRSTLSKSQTMPVCTPSLQTRNVASISSLRSTYSSLASCTKARMKPLKKPANPLYCSGDEADDEAESDIDTECISKSCPKTSKRLPHSYSVPNLKNKRPIVNNHAICSSYTPHASHTGHATVMPRHLSHQNLRHVLSQPQMSQGQYPMQQRHQELYELGRTREQPHQQYLPYIYPHQQPQALSCAHVTRGGVYSSTPIASHAQRYPSHVQSIPMPPIQPTSLAPSYCQWQQQQQIYYSMR